MTVVPKELSAGFSDGTEIPGQTEQSKATVRGALDAMRSMAETAASAIESGGAKVRTVENGRIVEAARGPEEDARRQDVIEKVGRFLDTKLHGPRFIGSARGKLFIGEFPRQQQVLDIQMLVGNKMKDGSDISVGEYNSYVINELRAVLFGWVPIKSDKAQLLRANIDAGREEWDRLGIKLNPVEWMASRDPYLVDEEVQPLWRQYLEWKKEVEPTKEDFDFYYGLM